MINEEREGNNADGEIRTIADDKTRIGMATVCTTTKLNLDRIMIYIGDVSPFQDNKDGVCLCLCLVFLFIPKHVISELAPSNCRVSVERAHVNKINKQEN